MYTSPSLSNATRTRPINQRHVHKPDHCSQVGLMQEYNEPMPGLLYEAELPAHAQHHRRRQPLAPTGACVCLRYRVCV